MDNAASPHKAATPKRCSNQLDAPVCPSCSKYEALASSEKTREVCSVSGLLILRDIPHSTALGIDGLLGWNVRKKLVNRCWARI